ncbi:MAG: hypothetical protein ACYTBX_17255, partial [Planctomycetota bacterium]
CFLWVSNRVGIITAEFLTGQGYFATGGSLPAFAAKVLRVRFQLIIDYRLLTIYVQDFSPRLNIFYGSRRLWS